MSDSGASYICILAALRSHCLDYVDKHKRLFLSTVSASSDLSTGTDHNFGVAEGSNAFAGQSKRRNVVKGIPRGSRHSRICSEPGAMYSGQDL